jgi:pyruvate dehydrogenase E2 component (dihydrolipoamide acetyltransferase)
VLEIYVREGDVVSKNQGLIELETDKATVTVPSPQAGKISKIMVAPGQAVAIGAVIVQLEAAGSSSAQTTSQPASSPKSTVAATSTPTAPAAPVTVSPIPAPTVTPVASAPQPKPAATTAATSQPTGTKPASAGAQPVAATAVPSASETTEALVPASPAVRRFAREVGVDLVNVQGSGDGGRITRDDVLRSVRESHHRSGHEVTVAPAEESGEKPTQATSAPTGGKAPKTTVLPGIPGSDDYGAVRVEKLSKIRKTIALQMHKSWTTAPQVTNFDDADVTELELFRSSSKDDYAARGIKLTSMPFLIKAVATALRNHPTINAKVDLENEQVIYHDYVNVGVAVDTERGLVVPNIRNAHQLSIPEIAQQLADMAQRVRAGDFSVGELRGGTFTISNLGAIGGTYSTPIVNVPEVAILLAGRTRKLPVVLENDSVRVRQMMPLSLSYDHRLVDGGTAARFLNEVISLLEAPSRLLLAIS